MTAGRGAWVAVLLMAASIGMAAQTPAAALSRAHDAHERLLATPIAERQASDYDAIVTVLAQAWSDAQAPEADDARFAAASIYVDEARDLRRDAAYSHAAKLFLELLHTSPYTSYRRNAEFALAQIQIFHLHEPAAARVWLRDFAQRYPADPRAGVVLQEIRGVKVAEPQYLLEAESSSAAPPRPVAAPTPEARAANAAPAGPARPRTLAVKLGNVHGIQVFSHANGSSVVVELGREAAFTRGVDAATGAVYFDVSVAGAPRGRASGSDSLEVNDGRIATVRVRARPQERTRIEITTQGKQKIDRGRYFPNPSRLVISVSAAGKLPAR